MDIRVEKEMQTLIKFGFDETTAYLYALEKFNKLEEGNHIIEQLKQNNEIMMKELEKVPPYPSENLENKVIILSTSE
jgi:hypothetical protein